MNDVALRNLDLGDRVINDNLQMLCNRLPGQKFYVDNTGRLQIQSGCRKLFDKICSLFCCCAHREVKNCISRTVRAITPERVKDLRNQGLNFCEDLFFKKMSRLSLRIFDRSSIQDGIKQILLKSVENERVEKVFKQDELSQSRLIEKIRENQKHIHRRTIFGRILTAAGRMVNRRGNGKVQQVITRTVEEFTPGYVVELSKSQRELAQAQQYAEKEKDVKRSESQPRLLGLDESDEKAGSAGQKSSYEAFYARFTPRRQEYEKRIKEAYYRQNLGLNIEQIMGGSSGVYAARSLANKRILALKPFDEGPYGPNNPRLPQRIKRWVEDNIFPCFIRPDLIRNTEYIAEAAASAVHEVIVAEVAKLGIDDFDVIPYTRLEEFRSKKFKNAKEKVCSCKIWIDNFVPATDIVPVKDFSLIGKGLWYYKNKTLPANLTEKFQWFAILEFVFGNQDGKPDNIAIQRNNVIGFDFGLSAPNSHPADVRSTIRQYAWAEITNAADGFTEKSKRIIRCIYESQRQIYEAAHVTGYRIDQTEAMMQRIKVLNSFQNSSPRELAKVKTPAQFARVLTEINRAEERAKKERA